MELIESTEPYLCLNMIVKNEGHIIKDTLTKLLNKIPVIDYWVISDTGSTDETKEIISDFFKERNINGELFDDEWKDFGHNRTKALEHAFGKSRFLMVFDADDEICGDFVLPDLKIDSYHFQFGDVNGISYTRTQIINNKKKWKYVGVLHEIITCCEHSNGMDTIKGNYYTISGKSGSRSQDQNKYQKDALILEKAYDEAVKNNDDLYHRYGFYCANSYYDCGKWGHAIKWYKITLSNNNWSQEKYVACQRLYNCYNSLNEKEKGIYYLVKSFAYDKERAECLSELVSYYCSNDMNEVAYSYYNIVKSFYNERYLKDGLNDKLFLDVSKANMLMPFYMILVADKVKDHDTITQMYRIIFTKKHIERSKHYIGNMLYNLQFFIERVKDDNVFLRLFQEYVEFLISIDYPVYEHEFMVNYEKYGIINTYSVISIFKKEEYSKNKKILIYTGYMNFLWNDSTVKTQSIGGAEKAVVYLSRQFPKDYDIYIVGDQLEEQIDNIRYINRNKLQELLNQNEFHTIIISRYVSFFEEYNNIKCYKLLLYAHDSTGFINNYNRKDINYILEQCNDYVDKVVCLTNWHSNNIIQRHPFLKDKIEIINNGINIIDFPTNKIQKISNKFLWSSCAYRGLHILLNLWSDILNILPDATLDICSYDSFPKNKEEEEMLKTINMYDSITYRGKLNTSELYDLMAKTEYWLYTNTFPETSCITGMEMLMSEVICLYYPLAGLVDTVGVYGIPIERGQEIETIVNLTNKRKTEIRKLGKEYALSCSWENRAKKWSNLLFLDNDSLNIEKRTFTNNNIENTKIIDYKIEYGVDDNKINITHTVISHLLNKEFIEIPTNDILRSELYGDPCWGVVKSIYITTKDGSVTKCKDNYPIILNWQGILIKKPNFKYKLSACLLIKNETENLNDWIEHYINEGVEHFFITSNNSTDGIDNFILNSKYKNMITLITDNSDINIYNDQVKHREILCKNFYNIIKNSTEWCILVDIDEFMYGKNGYTLSSFIDTLDEDIGCFYVYWNIFKPTLDSENNISDKFSLKKSCKRINLDLISDLSYEIKFVSKFGKSIFRTSMLQDHTQIWIHKVHTSGKIITNYGNISNYKYDNADDINWSESNYTKVNVALNHYAIRNKKDYDNKSSQLENTHRYPFVKGLLDIFELDNNYIIEDEYILNKYRIPEERITYSKKINKIGIFNSFPFHYEMFGFILNYAQKNNYEVDIFTNKNKSLGWFEFYKERFNNFNINEIGKFNGDTSEYATFFLTTDDDSQFKSEWIRDNVVCVNHYYRIRRSNFKHYLNVANFKDSTLEYVYPCYPLINYRDKIQNSTNVCIIGGGNIHHNHNINVINRLQSNGRIKLNIFVRKDCKTNISELEINKFDINFIEDISTSKMIQILNQSSYVLVNYNDNQDHNNGISCSGSLQLALSTLCKPIIINTANKYLQIKNALEYDIKSNEPIFIDKEIDFQLLEQERNNYVDKFDKYIGNILSTVYLRILSDSGTSNNMEDWMQTDKLRYMYNKPVVLTKKDDFTHCIIINSGMPHLNINKNKVVGISHEPTLPQEPLFSQLIEYSKNNMSKYFIGDKNNLPEPFTEGQTFMFHNTTRYNNITKTKFCSIVISGKQFTMGHKYRHKLVEAILKTDLPIDIYGYGVEKYKQKMDDARLKYSLENTLKNPFGTDPFIDYKFHICIENIVSNNYFSEKIINPLLSNVIPIYYGCKKIDNYFDNIIKLSCNEEDDIKLLKYIYQNQNMYESNVDSDKILDKCNMFYNLHTFFDDIKLKDEIIIPKKIFQTWETSDIEAEFQQIINKWKENNPNYEYIFHDAEQRVQFIQDNFKENVLNAYKKIIPGAYKCDLWRYCVLYIYGGFYADIDTLCMGKLNSLTNKNIEFIVPIDLNINPREGEHNLACGFIGSVSKSPILLDAIDRIVFNVENNIIPTSKLDFSGPGLLGRAVNKFLNLDETSSFKGKEGIRNNINFLEFDPNTEYMKDVYADSTILQNKNRNSDIIRLYNNECNKIKNYTCWLSNNVINTDL